MKLESSGIAVDLPRGWDGAIFTGGADGGSAALRQQQTGGRLVDPGSGTTTPGHAVLHAASFPLPAQRGDYGSGAVDRMVGEDMFLALLEFHPDSARTPLFAQRGMPDDLGAQSYRTDQLQRTLPGQAGVQRFFSVDGRAFCLYVVLGAFSRRAALAPRVGQVLAATTIGPRP